MKVTYSREKINPFGGLNFINSTLKRNGTFDFIDNQLGNRSDLAEYTNSDIIKAMWYTVYSGGDCAEDIEDHLKAYLSSLNSMKVPSADTLLRVQKKLATVKETILSDTGIEHDYNINEKLNRCNIRLLVHLGMLCSEDEDIVFDYDNQFIPTGKYDSKHSYKHKDGYFPGIAMINDMPVYIENRNGNSNVKFNQAPTLERAYSLLLDEGIKVKLSRMDCGSFAKDIIGTVEKYSEYFYIRAQRCEDLYGKIKGIGYWETVEIGFKQYEIASIEYAPFGA